MEFIVCIKQVPAATELKFDHTTKRLIREGIPNTVNTFDRHALTEALRLRDEFGGSITVLTMGPPQAREALAECIALGADRAFHLLDRAFAGADTLATSRALAAAIERQEFDLILCGKYSTDAETAQVPPEVAELLNIPQATGVTKIEVAADKRSITVVRETDEGFETLQCDLPALVTTSERLNKPKRTSRTRIEEVGKSTDIPVVSAKDLAQDLDKFGATGSPTYVASIMELKQERKCEVLQVSDPTEAAQKLAEFLIAHQVFSPGKLGDQEEFLIPENIRSGQRGKGFLVFAEIVNGEPIEATFELLGRASQLSLKIEGNVECVVLGDLFSDFSKLVGYGADVVLDCPDERLNTYLTETYAAILHRVIASRQPYAVLFPSTALGRDLAPRLAARLGIGLTGDCIGLEINEEGSLVQLKPAFGGNIVAPILSRTRPQMATIRPGILKRGKPNPNRKPRLAQVEPDPLPESRTKILSRQLQPELSGVKLGSAGVVIGVGYGLGGPENLGLITPLAKLLGAEIAATRKIVDRDWLPRQQQVGLTGRSIAPAIYIAAGISGAINHLVGIRNAHHIVAINLDPNAHIFKNCDLGLVGDSAKIIPALTRQLERAKQRLK